MSVLNSGTLAIGFYLGALILQISQMLRPSASESGAGSSPLVNKGLAQPLLLILSGCALLAHLSTSRLQMISVNGLDFSLMPISVSILFIVNLIVVVSCLRQPLLNLLLFLFPASIAVITASLVFDGGGVSVKTLTPGLGVHILFSILAYSLMTIAAVEALFLAYQNRQLHQHQTGGLMRVLPPMQTMEHLLFNLVAVGFVFLTLALIAGFAFVENFIAQHLAHKTVFSILAWVVYAILLWGRYRLGWRGKIATLWTLGGFLALMLAFWGSKFVLEVLLSNPSN